MCELFIFDHNTDCFKQKIVQEATAKTQQIIVFFQIETQSNRSYHTKTKRNIDIPIQGN